jgi:spore maturation protein SpmA/spore maturation protein SpmB
MAMKAARCNETSSRGESLDGRELIPEARQRQFGPRARFWGGTVLNWIWLGLVLSSVAYAAWSGRMTDVSSAALAEASAAIQLVIKLTGGMVLFLGLVRVAADGGLLRVIVRALRPILRRLFPEVPEDHPAMGAMLMNFAANMLGMGNAATPFGVKAMAELDRLNPHRGSATNAMALFLAINTSSIVLMAPTGTVVLREATGSTAPMAIWIPTLFATLCSTLVAVTTCLFLSRLPRFAPRPPDELPPVPDPEPAGAGPDTPDLAAVAPPLGLAQWVVLVGFGLTTLAGLGWQLWNHAETGTSASFLKEVGNHWLLPLLIAGFLLIGVAGRVRVYDVVVDAGREGLQIALRIAPYLVAILVGIGMFRASGALELVVAGLAPLTGALGVPAEALPMALLRPLSGSGAYGVMAEILATHGPDSFVGQVASTLQGSTETTFYVLAVYLGAAGVRDARHILPACLAGDLAGFAGAVFACHVWFG